MKATCIKCRLSATVTLTGRDQQSITQPDRFAFDCPILAEKLKVNGKLDGADLNCPHLNNAIAAAVDQVRRKLGF